MMTKSCLTVCLAAFVLATSSVSVFAYDATPDEPGFKSLMPTKEGHQWEDTVIVTEEGYLDGDGCYIGSEFGDFVLRFEFKVTPGANSGVGIRTVKGQNAAYSGMEIQVLEDSHPKYKNLKDWQYHGSIYGVVAAKKGALKPIGEWNKEEIYANGDHIKVTLNGIVIVDAKLNEVAPNGKTIDGKDHPGLFRESGFLRLAGHGGGVQFRNMRIKTLD